MTKSKGMIMTAAQVIAVNEDKAMLTGGFLVKRTSDCECGKYWVLRDDGTEGFLEHNDMQKELF